CYECTSCDLVSTQRRREWRSNTAAACGNSITYIEVPPSRIELERSAFSSLPAGRFHSDELGEVALDLGLLRRHEFTLALGGLAPAPNVGAALFRHLGLESRPIRPKRHRRADTKPVGQLKLPLAYPAKERILWTYWENYSLL